MPVLESTLDTRSESFKANKADMLEMLQTVEDLLEEAAEGAIRRAVGQREHL